MKFPFPTGRASFLHDTPRREHFAKANRAISNGCIRVEDYRRLAYWVFGRDVAAVGSDPEQHLSLPRGIPVYVTYLTMVPEASGMTTFADRYGWDRPGAMAGGMDAGFGVGAAGRDAVAGGGGAGSGSLAVRRQSRPQSSCKLGSRRPSPMVARASSDSLLVTG